MNDGAVSIVLLIRYKFSELKGSAEFIPRDANASRIGGALQQRDCVSVTALTLAIIDRLLTHS
jgi:hypothetical protein